MAKTGVVLSLEVADDHRASCRVFQWFRLRRTLRSRLLKVSIAAVVPRRSRRDMRARLSVAELLQHLGNELWSVVHPQHLRRSAGGAQHFREFGEESVGGDGPLDDVEQRDPGVVDAILMGMPSMWMSNWKSFARNTFAASASTGGIDDTPALFAYCAPAHAGPPSPSQVMNLPRFDLSVR
ncbi:hypothetical protein ABQF35_30470 [Mycobacterium syngnathidarum]